MNNIIEGNILIAQFMGVTVANDIRDNEFHRCGYRVLTVKANYTMPFYINCRTAHIKPKDDVDIILKEQEKAIWEDIGEKALYHKSWDWLMPVCVKLNMDTVSTDINKTYEEVVKRILEASK